MTQVPGASPRLISDLAGETRSVSARGLRNGVHCAMAERCAIDLRVRCGSLAVFFAYCLPPECVARRAIWAGSTRALARARRRSSGVVCCGCGS